jgi:hypothetical protein
MSCTNKTDFFDQSKNIYNTQGEMVNQTQHQKFSDNFICYLKNNNKKDVPVYADYINKCYPACCNPIKWDVSDNIIDVKYYNEKTCIDLKPKKYRIG